ncbi:MAG: pyridoxamine 5'-phosphate oxidase family protein [Bacteroidetes bacterium]|nr:pyridoxamine 5'-phosphate oxidase family protein [Bacteroidota bacterium]
MTKKEIILKIDELLDNSNCAILSTVSSDIKPCLRWMYPTIFPDMEQAIYAITSADFLKVEDLKKNPSASWMFQTKELNEIINVSGKINIIDNPSLKSMIIEKIGSKLHAFWKLKKESSDYIALETIIEYAVYFNPMEGEKEIVKFSGS